MSQWYSHYMPKIKEITKSLPLVAEKLKAISRLKSAYVIGSYVTYKNNPNQRIRDIDIVIKTSFHSEDMMAIDNEIIKLSGKKEYLEEQGFDPEAIKFSQNLINAKEDIWNLWVISKDKKLLHWGPIPENIEELNIVNKNAEEYAHKTTGFNLSKMKKLSEIKRKNWYNVYKNYLNTYFSNMPLGWYQSNTSVKHILDSSIRL